MLLLRSLVERFEASPSALALVSAGVCRLNAAADAFVGDNAALVCESLSENSRHDVRISGPDGSHIDAHRVDFGDAVVFVLRDVTAEVARGSEMEEMAYSDPLTGLPNRRRFTAEVKRILADSVHVGSAIAFFDLNDFKGVNDTYGHDIGDHVLCIISDRMVKSLRDQDLVTRLGGDEFAVLLHGVCDVGEAHVIVGRAIESLSSPISTSVGIINVGVSVGIALFPDDGADMDSLLKAADTRMYQIKEYNSVGISR